MEIGADGETGSETVGPEYIGPDRVPITNHETLQSHPFQTIAQIELNIPAQFGEWHCMATGFLVGPRHVLTNHHVLADCVGIDLDVVLAMIPRPPGFSFQVFPGRAKGVDLNGGAWNVESIVWGPTAWTNSWWGGEDYALLVLEDDPNRSGELGRMGMCSPSNSTLEGLPVYLTGYPGPTYPCTNSPDPGGNCGGWMLRGSRGPSASTPPQWLI